MQQRIIFLRSKRKSNKGRLLQASLSRRESEREIGSKLEENKSSKPCSDLLQHPPSSKESEAVEQAAEDTELSQPIALRKGKRSRQITFRYRDSLTADQEACPANNTEMASQKTAILAKLYKKYNSEQFTKQKAPDIPEWLYIEAVASELQNWKSQYEHVKLADVPADANVIGSHLVYRIKKDEKGQFRFKARLVVHGNEDEQKDAIRKDAATAHLVTIRLILSMATCYNFELGQIDIKAAYFQSGPIKRRVYVRPPQELLLFRTLWLLLGLPYGIVETGRQ